MKRRDFLRKTGAVSVLAASYPKSYSLLTSADPMDRLAMSTVNFRERFHQTRSKELGEKYSELKLTEIPEYFRDRFGLQNVELWSKHFESIEPSYLKELNKALKKSKSTLVNIQFDEDYQLGSPDEKVRKESLEFALKWLDVADVLNAEAFRVNPMSGDVNHVIEAMKIINEKATGKGLIFMVENHFGMEMDPDIHLKIVKSLGDNAYTLPDYGNYSDEQRYDSLKKIMPYAYQISAKTMAFDENMKHVSYDFDKCMKIATENGFNGIYSVEQWSPNPDKDTGREEKMADWMIEKVRQFL